MRAFPTYSEGRPAGARVIRMLFPALAILFVSASCVSAQSDVPPLERRAHELNGTIMCPICPGESIDQSQATIALQMRDIVREKLEQGWTDDQIRDFFVERYGPSVLLEPPREGFSLAAWVIPPVSVAAAAIAFFFALRWMKRPPPAQTDSSIETVSLSDDELAGYYARIEAALEGADGAASRGGKAERKGSVDG